MDKLKKAAVSLIPFIAATSPAYAQSQPSFTIKQPEGFHITDLGAVVTSAISVALVIAGVLVFAFLVMGGIQWIMSGGDKAKTEEARSRITAALVGLAIVACAWAIMLLVGYFFGIGFGNLEIPQPF